MEKRLLNIVLLGPPGSGKSVQVELLEKHFKFKKILMGDILRIEIRKKTKIGDKIKSAMDKGKLIDSKVVLRLAKKHIGNAKKNLIFDGFPRDLYEAGELDRLIYVTHVFFIDVPDKTIIKRLSSRYECYCGMTYNLTSKKPRHDLTCDKCGRKLYRREDDKPMIIRERLKVYRKETLHLIKYYRDKVININGNKRIKEVYGIIRKRLS